MQGTTQYLDSITGKLGQNLHFTAGALPPMHHGREANNSNAIRVEDKSIEMHRSGSESKAFKAPLTHTSA